MGYCRNVTKFKYFLVAFISFSLFSSVSAMSLEDYIAQYNRQDAPYIAQAIYETADRYELDPLFVASVFQVESGFHNSAVSPAGALGIAQLMPGTAEELGVNPYDPIDNIEGGTRYLREMLDLQNPHDPYKYNLALASYNAGPGAVHGYAPTFTYEYIEMVTSAYNEIIAAVDTPYMHHGHVPKEVRIPEKEHPVYHPSKKERLTKAIGHLLKERRVKEHRSY